MAALEFIGNHDSTRQTIQPEEHDAFAREVSELPRLKAHLSIDGFDIDSTIVLWKELSIRTLQFDGAILSIGLVENPSDVKLSTDRAVR